MPKNIQYQTNIKKQAEKIAAFFQIIIYLRQVNWNHRILSN